MFWMFTLEYRREFGVLEEIFQRPLVPDFPESIAKHRHRDEPGGSSTFPEESQSRS